MQNSHCLLGLVLLFFLASKFTVFVGNIANRSHFPRRGINLKSCILLIFLQEPLKHIKVDHDPIPMVNSSCSRCYLNLCWYCPSLSLTNPCCLKLDWCDSGWWGWYSELVKDLTWWAILVGSSDGWNLVDILQLKVGQDIEAEVCSWFWS